jgi:hypothetical protein
VQVPYVHLGDGPALPCDGAHVAKGVEVVEGFEVVTQGFAADGDALLNHQHRFHGGQRVPLDGVRGVGQLKVVRALQVADAMRSAAQQGIKLGLLGSDACGQVLRAARSFQGQSHPGVGPAFCWTT